MALLKLFSLIMFLAIILSCDKTDATTVSGYIYEVGTQKPIKNAKLIIAQPVRQDFMDFYTNLVDTVITDEKGYFHWNSSLDPINQDYDKEGYFELLRVSADGYFNKKAAQIGHPETYFPSFEHSFIEVYLIPKAYLQVNVENTTGITFAEFSLRSQSIVINLDGENMSKDFEVRGNNMEVFRIKSYSTNYEYITDSIYMSAGDRKTISFQY